MTNPVCLKIDRERLVHIGKKVFGHFHSASCPFSDSVCDADCPLFDLDIEDEKNMSVTFHCGTGATYQVAYLENENA